MFPQCQNSHRPCAPQQQHHHSQAPVVVESFVTGDRKRRLDMFHNDPTAAAATADSTVSSASWGVWNRHQPDTLWHKRARREEPTTTSTRMATNTTTTTTTTAMEIHTGATQPCSSEQQQQQQQQPVWKTKAGVPVEWWKQARPRRIPHDVCYICLKGVPQNNNNSTNTRPTPVMPVNALHKYFGGTKAAATTSITTTTTSVSKHHHHCRSSCSFCEHVVCGACLQTCQDCQLPFCTTCSLTNSLGTTDVLCFECADARQTITANTSNDGSNMSVE